MWTWLCAGCLGAALASSPDPAEVLPEAEDAQVLRSASQVIAPERWHMQLAVGTNFPLDIGGQFTLETPFRLRLHLGLGGMPEGFQDLAHSVAVSAGAYERELADALSATLQSAFVLHAAAGIRPIPGKGLAFDVGYRLIRFDARNTPETLVAAIPGASVPAEWQQIASTEVRLTSLLHQVAVRAGWEWFIKSHLLVRVDVGGSFTVDTSHTLTASKKVALPAGADRQVDVGQAWLDTQLVKYAHTPTLGLSVGYRF